MKLLSLMLFALPAVAGGAWAHGGGLNKEGCHNDRKNGGYHCHRTSNPAPVERSYQPANQLAPSTTPHPHDHPEAVRSPTVRKHVPQEQRPSDVANLVMGCIWIGAPGTSRPATDNRSLS
jgi:hypothetical protein